ncbi:MAG: hypothetical protein VB089_09980 [Anaerolineaceae bacterium]|nr:hypothetical protein [Anaerolineaceae bacterium]
MHTRTRRLVAAALAFSWVMSACILSDLGPTPTPTPTPPPTQTSSPTPTPTATPRLREGGAENSRFPLPPDVRNYTELSDQANFQTSLSLEDAIAFYRQALGRQGWSERSLLTTITDNSFSLTFESRQAGPAIVVQGLDLGNGTVNINLRSENL